MKYGEKGFTYHIYEDKFALPPQDVFLIDEASRATQSAYAPYSGYKVGVAIHTVEDQIILGSNQENGAYPIGQCAERVALYSLIHQYGRVPVDVIAISVDFIDQLTPASPCGSCRQILHEYRLHQNEPIRLLLALTSGGVVYEIPDASLLLPMAFDGRFLGQ